MKAFRCTFRDKSGKVSTERIEADDQARAVDMLFTSGYMVLTIVEETTGSVVKRRGGSGKKIKNEDIVLFIRQFATMIDAGLPMLQCLVTLVEQAEPGQFHDMMAALVDDVNRGRSLSEALAVHSKVFDKLFINMVRAGETGGFLAEILERLATHLEAAASLRRKVKSAMMYPIVVLCIALGVTAVLVVKVIPTFKSIFLELNIPLPLPTRILLAVSDFTRGLGGIAIVVAVVGLVLAVRYYYRTPSGRLVIDRLIFKVPVMGMLVQKVAIARLTSTLATLVSSGVPIISSLEIVSESCGNEVINGIVKDAMRNTERGEPIASAMSNTPYIPRMVAKMIEVGESTGRLDQMLKRISQYYSEQVNTAVNGLTALVEPVLIVFLGVVVGGIMISMFMPMFQLTSIIK